MKTKLTFAIFAMLVFSAFSFAQSVTITPKKVTYTRPKPIMDFKKTFTVTYPIVKAATPALSKKIEKTISYEDINGLNIEEEKGEIQWLEEATYEVGYNDKGILTITLSVSGTGAYPSVSEKTVVVDLKTGNQIAPKDVFTNLENLAAKVKEAQKDEIEKSVEEIKSDPENKDFEPSEYFDNADFTVENLSEFSVDENGVTFIYDYGFPHVIQAFQPEGRFFYSWDELKPFIRRDGLLAQFVR